MSSTSGGTPLRSHGFRRARTAAVLIALVSTALAGTTGVGPASASARVRAGEVAPSLDSTRTAPTALTPASTRAVAKLPGRVVCPTAAPGYARCLSSWITWSKAGSAGAQTASPATTSAQAAATAPAGGPVPVVMNLPGLRPADIRQAYDLPAVGGKGQTIGIVDAFDDPKVEADLKVYRSHFKLPACTTKNTCFRKVDQRGGKSYPVGDPSWGQEISLDVQAVSAVCPSCHILLVEADDNSSDALGLAENTAVRLGATVVTNSYGETEANGQARLKKYYTHPGVPIVASSGDNGFQDAEFPADLASTWAIGGTLLTPAKKKGTWSEQAADFGSSACSAWIAKPSYQKDTHCGMRTIADISAAADGLNGFSVYDTYGQGSADGWGGAAGTSLSSPLVAAMIGLAGNPAEAAKPSYAYAHRSGLKDVVGGTNLGGFDDCGTDYLCNAVKGYDAPTGLGSPHGLKAL